MPSTKDRGYALRIIRQCDGWTGPNHPEEFERVHDSDEALIRNVLEEVRRDERYRIADLLAGLQEEDHLVDDVARVVLVLAVVDRVRVLREPLDEWGKFNAYHRTWSGSGWRPVPKAVERG